MRATGVTRVGIAVGAVAAAIALSACGGGSNGGGLAVGDCTDFAPSAIGGPDPAKVDCSSPSAKSVVTKVAAGAGNMGTCPFGQTSYDDPGASGMYVCLKGQ